MDINKIKKFLINNKVKVGITCLVIVFVITSITYYFYSSNTVSLLKLKKMDFIFELGEKINKSPEFYLDTSKLKKDEKEKLLNKTTVKLPQKYDKLGKYEVLLSYKNDSVKAKVEIVDTIPPVFETVDNMTVPLGTQYTDEQLKEMFKVSDADEYELKIDNGGYNANAEGVYTITAEAKDKTGNSTKYSFTITVTAAVTEIQYTENTTQAESTVTETKKTTNSDKTNSESTSSNSSHNNSTSGINNNNNPANGGNNNNSNTDNSGIVYVKSVSISGNTTGNVSNNLNFNATVNPNNASNIGYGSYKWTTNSGNLKIVAGQGLANVIVTSDVAGTYTLTCTVNGVSNSINVTFKTVEVSQDVDFNKVKVKIKTPSGGEIVKSVKELNFQQNGKEATASITVGNNYGLVWNNPGDNAIIAAGLWFTADESMWYVQTPGPESYHTTFSGSHTVRYKSYNGYSLSITYNVGSVNVTHEEMIKILYG